MENNLKDMGKLHFTDERKRQLMKKVKENANQNKVIKFTKISKVSAVAACLCLVSVTAYATGILAPVTDIFAPIFGSSAAQTEIIEKIGRPIGASDTDEGITITAEAIIGDKNNVCVVFKVAQEDGLPLELPEYVENTSVWNLNFWNEGITIPALGGSTGKSYFEKSEDGHYRFVQMLSYDVDIPLGEKVTASFENLSYFTEIGEQETLVNGKWSMKFDLNYENSSVLIDVNESFIRDDITFNVESVQVSPIGYLVNYSIDEAMSPAQVGDMTETQIKEHQTYFADIELVFTLKDGTMLDCTGHSGGLIPFDDYTLANKADIFDEIIPLDEILCITVGDIEIFLD